VHELVVDLSLERLRALYEALPERGRMALAGALATVLHARPMKVPRMPMETQVKALRACLKRAQNDDLAQELLGAYFLGPRLALVTGFLDGTGVEHKDGSVEDEAEPDAAKVPGAVKALLKEHDSEDVLLYLRVAKIQWPKNEAIAKEVDALAGTTA